jgi:hypothetical protein
LDGRLERAKEAALGPHDDHPSVGDLVGEAAGGISGVLAGAAIGSLGGPVGTVIGGIAGAIGGWWSGRAISEAVGKITEDDETHYREHYERAAVRNTTARRYDDARPAYHLGHIAGMNPDYKGRSFDEVEEDLQRGWNDDVRTRYGEWDAVRGYVEEAYNWRVATPEGPSGRAGAPDRKDSPADPSRQRADETEVGKSGRVEPERDRSPADGSGAGQGQSIPRGTDESPRP